MTATQENIIKKVADKEDINVATVRQIFKTAENIIFDYLSSSSPTEKIDIKIFNGMSIGRNYVGEKIYSKGMFEDLNCPEHINLKATISKYYNNKVNEKLFGQTENT